MLGDKYKIEVSFPGSGLTLTYPTNSTFEWTWEKEDGQIYYRKKLNTNLFFRDNVDLQVELHGHDFGKLYNIERSRQSRCDKVDVIVSKRCNKTDAWVQHYNGYLSMIDGKWDVSHCEVEIPIRPQDQYTCLYENWERNEDILKYYFERYDSRSTIGVIEYKTCYRETEATKLIPPNYAPGCLSIADQVAKKWTLVSWIVNEGESVETIWAREVFNGSKPGPDWVDDGGSWVRNVEVLEDKNEFFEEGGRLRRKWKIIAYTITNGMKLNDILPEMVARMSQCQYKLISNFYGIAPDHTNPNNRPYSHAFDHCRNLYLYHKQDIRLAKGKDESSTKLDISFKRMYENLRSLHNLGFTIDKDTNTIRLEHISYFKEKRMLDLTSSKFIDDIKASWKYTYDKQQLPIRENFKFMEPTSFEFDAGPIEYEAACSNDQKSANDITFTADYMVTAVDDIVEHPDKYSEQGIVIIERSDLGFIVSGDTFRSGVQRNGNLAWGALQDVYYRFDRPQAQGSMNGQLTNFDSFKRTRKQVPIQIQLCCSDFDQFDPLDLVRTQLGWGEIVSAKYNEPQEVMTLEIIHD